MLLNLLAFSHISAKETNNFTRSNSNEDSITRKIDRKFLITQISHAKSCLKLLEDVCSIWRIEEFIKLLQKYSSNDKIKLISTINGFVNAFNYMDDYREPDGDAPKPILNFFVDGGGDCEDYAIVKYSLLRAIGFESRELSIAITHDNASQTSHAVLLIKTKYGHLILDHQKEVFEIVNSKFKEKLIFEINETGFKPYGRVLNMQAIVNKRERVN